MKIYKYITAIADYIFITVVAVINSLWCRYYAHSKTQILLDVLIFI